MLMNIVLDIPRRNKYVLVGICLNVITGGYVFEGPCLGVGWGGGGACRGSHKNG